MSWNDLAAGTKRTGDISSIPTPKKSRHDNSEATALIISEQKQLIIANPAVAPNNQPNQRSSLPSPLLTLIGHNSPIYSCRFNATGRIFASVGADPHILLWSYPQLPSNQPAMNDEHSNNPDSANVFNYGRISSHKSTTLDCDFHQSEPYLYTCSADQTVHFYDVETSKRIRNFRFHSDIVNSVRAMKANPINSNTNENLFISGSNDNHVNLYDSKTKHVVHKFKHSCPVLAVEISGNQYYYGGLDNTVHINDIRTHKLLFDLQGHTNSISNLSLNNDSAHLLSSSHDNTLKAWDIQSFSNRSTRLLQNYTGSIQLGLEQDLIRSCWSNNNQFIIAGSVDRCVWIWDAESGEVKYRLPGHKGAVLNVAMHPSQPVILSASTDRTMILGEL
jgi:Prp8 binding protein